MAILNEKLLLYKVTGYIKHCVTHGKYCIPLGQSGSGSMIEDHSDHSASIGTAKSTLDQDSSVAMIRRDPSSGRSTGGGRWWLCLLCRHFLLLQFCFTQNKGGPLP